MRLARIKADGAGHYHCISRIIERRMILGDVDRVIAQGGKLPMHVLLRCRVRYFSDGLALGSQDFVDKLFERYRAQFGRKRKTGARPMTFADWPLDMCTLRNLRTNPVSCS